MSDRLSKRIERRALYGVALVCAMLLPRLSTAWVLRLGRGIGRLLYQALPKRRRIAEENLRAAFPDWDDQRVRRTVREHFAHLGMNLVEFFQLPAWDRRLAPRIRLEDASCVRALVEKRTPFLVFIPHLGNWEILAPLWPTLHPAPMVLVQPMPDPRLDALVRRCRGVTGLEMVDRRGGLRRVVAALRQGRAIGLLADQDAGPGGVMIPFFGRLASCEPSPAALARRLEAPLLLNWTVREASGEHRVFFELVPVDPTDDRETLKRIYRRLEAIIGEHPEQWLWIHRRWKSAIVRSAS
ncbi:MAG: acyltransferase [Candidatus Poribacteria bacterium]|nr:MAG: acyltransferase [Candidatus Poribacteria bacterium]